MKKLWPYISAFLLGIIGGVIAGVKLMGEKVTVEVRKVKNKKVSGGGNTSIPIEVEMPKKRRKQRKLDKLKNKS